MEINPISIAAYNPLKGNSNNMPFNIPNENQSIKAVSKNMPFNYDDKITRRLESEVYYNYNSRGERVRIHQVGKNVDIVVL